MILPIYNSLTKIGDDIINGAKDLGANNLQVYTYYLAIVFPGIVSGITMVFVHLLPHS